MPLKPLHIWEHDEEGNIVLDAEGHRVGLKGERAGQPKKQSELNKNELARQARDIEADEDAAIARAMREAERKAALAAITALAGAADRGGAA